MDLGMDKVEQILFLYGHDDQRTDAWHTKRGEMLTASEIYKAVHDASPALKHEIVMTKLLPRPASSGFGARALLWGTRLEPIAKHIYCTYIQGGVQIMDTTCIPHRDHPFLGASPDGILVTADKNDFRYGKLVEFKCPISREFSNDTPIPSTYYHQMQLQLECTDLDECDYVEMKFREVNYSEWEESTAQYKSWFAVAENGRVVYRDIDDKRDVQTWRKEMMPNLETEWWATVYWVFEKYRLTTVPRDRTWLPTNLESFRVIWNTVQEHRAAGTLPDHPKEKTILTI
jgi:putative phage-type endonuclease